MALKLEILHERIPRGAGMWQGEGIPRGDLCVCNGSIVFVAEDGAEGIRLVQAHNPDLVFCDLFMPEQDGLETLRALRKLRLAVPVVLMSGGSWTGDPGDLLRCAEMLGAAAVLQKPFSLEVLLQAVAAHARNLDCGLT